MAQDAGSEWRDGLPFFGGSAWLDLVNTTAVVDGAPVDFIAGLDDFRRWVKAAALPVPSPPDEADHQAALALRQGLREAAPALSAGGAPPAPLVETLNGAMAGLSASPKLAVRGGAAVLSQKLAFSGPPATALVAEDAARFVCEYEPVRLRGCASPTCTMVFYDRGRNNTRRWCSMSICGNREKVAAYRARKAGR